MLYYLFLDLSKHYSSFSFLRALTYVTSRTILALLTSGILAISLYPKAILLLRSMKAGQPIRELGFQDQMNKKGTPTMGGLVMVIAIVFSALLWTDVLSAHFFTLLIVTLGFCAVGFWDDYLKITQKNTAGFSSRKKFMALVFISLIALFWHVGYQVFLSKTPIPLHDACLVRLPFLKNTVLSLQWFYLPFAMCVLVGSSNAVNLTDGLDGLAIGPVITCALTLGILSYVTGNAIAAKYLFYHYVAGGGEVAVFLSAVIGASLGFLWFNCYPAQIFMGDSGALALGGILGAAALIGGHEVLLVLMGAVFVIEALSVMIQVVSFKTSGKRVFLMSPLHHHYQKKGWPEQKITIRVWILSFMLALFSILTLKLR